MSDKSSYPVPAETIETEQEIKKSRFIATVGHAPDKDSAVRFIEEISAKHSGASHNTYAFIAGNPNGGAEVGGFVRHVNILTDLLYSFLTLSL